MKNIILISCILILLNGCSTIERYHKEGVSKQQKQDDYDYCSKKASKSVDQKKANIPIFSPSGNMYVQSIDNTCYTCITQYEISCMKEKGYSYKRNPSDKEGESLVEKDESRVKANKNLDVKAATKYCFETFGGEPDRCMNGYGWVRDGSKWVRD